MDRQLIKAIITAPSLSAGKNVSGISSVVLEIERVLREDVVFEHVQIGAEQRGSKALNSALSILRVFGTCFRILFGSKKILHVNTALNNKSILRDVVLLAAARVRRFDIVLHLHGGRYMAEAAPRRIKMIIELAIGSSTEVIVLSETEKSFLKNNYKIKKSVSIHVIYNGTNVDLFPSKSNSNGSFENGPLRVIFAGRFAEEKGLDILLESFRSLDHDVATLDLYGDGPMVENVKRFCESNVACRYMGVFTAADRPQILVNYDALALPSLRGEGMPMIVIEAMAAGVVPICTPLSSIPEIITHNWNGRLIAAGDAKALAQAVREMANARSNVFSQSANARQFAEMNLSSDINFRHLVKIYRGLDKSLDDSN